MKHPLVPGTVLTALCAGVLAAASGVASAAGSDSSEDWQYNASIYLWGAGIQGQTARGADVDIGFDTLIKNLNMTFMGAFEARSSKWSFLTDVVYLNVGANRGGTVPLTLAPDTRVGVNVNASVKTKGWVLDFIGGYNLWNAPQGSLDVIAGARYLDLSLDFGMRKSVGPYVAARAFSASGSVWDGVIGVKGQVDLDPKWYVPYYLDLGTGQSDFTWQASAGFAYRFNWGDVSLVYRYMKWDLSGDSPIDHISFSGPLLAAKVQF
jgi:hypothetical protein